MNTNVVVLSGNLTRDPELKAFGQSSVCKLRIAVNDRTKNAQTGEWSDRPNYFDIDVFGGQGERCAQYLTRGAKIVVNGRLRWREWETQDGGKRQAVSVVANNVEWPPKAEQAAGAGQQQTPYTPPAQTAPPEEDYADDDIPF